MKSKQIITSRAIIGMFYARLSQDTGGDLDRLSFYVESDQESEDYGWLGQSPAMREAIGGRQAKGLSANGMTITNKEFEATLELPTKWLRRDKTGQVRVRIGEMASRAQSHWFKLVDNLIAVGGSQICYDGQYFFDTDHAEGASGAQSNAISISLATLPVTNSGTPTAPTSGEMEHIVMQAVQQLIGFKDDQGEPMNEDAREFLVYVPWSLWSRTYSGVNTAVHDGGNTNTIVNQDGFNITVRPSVRSPWTDEIAVFRTDGDVKAIIRQEEVPIQMSAIAEGSEHEFKNFSHQYGIFSSRNVGYGYWQKAVKIKLVA